MTKISLKINGTSVFPSASGKITSGMVGLQVNIEYDETWIGLEKKAFFRVGGKIRKRENVGEITTVPWEILRNHGKPLEIGIEGCDSEGSIVIPTVWAVVGMVYEGANGEIPASPPPSGDISTPESGTIIDDSQVSYSTTWSSQKIYSEINSSTGGEANAVLYTEQILNENQKKQARDNIGTASVEELHVYIEETILGGSW